jgi:hypothetical protein
VRVRWTIADAGVKGPFVPHIPHKMQDCGSPALAGTPGRPIFAVPIST